MKRHLLTLVAVASLASYAGAQEPAKPVSRDDSKAAMQSKSHGKKGMKARRYTTTSAGTLDRSIDNGGPGYSVHATSRDLVGADASHADDLFRREQLMDAKCGKSRERCGKP